jgi:hypothetical protein
MKYQNIREEELKNKVGADWFKNFDTTEIIGNIDFSVFAKQNELFERTPLLWAEAKTGNFDVVTMFVQLILTIGKARTFDKTMPPAFLGAFDFKKIAFVPYIAVQDIFYLNDFNWNVTPSNHETKEFLLIKERIEATLQQNTFVFDYQKDEKDLEFFIKNNIAKSTSTSKLKIDKNNFIPIYLRWLEIVKPQIDTPWDDLKKANILDSDFFLADLFVDDKDTQQLEDDSSIRDNLFVVYQNQGYKIAKENIKQMFDATIGLKNKDTYLQFWKRYKRPPIKEFQEYIIERRDLLVPQDIRERKGAFFTPRIWVELSQKYLTDYLGENWQDDYYVWDCAAGTGNLLAGLTNKYNIYASTLDQADVNVIHERIDHGANLLKGNVFQFDFLNDDFVPISKGGKMPDSLCDIISSKEKRKKLVVYINPPYAESNGKVSINRSNLQQSKIYNKYNEKLNKVAPELFAQFLARIYYELYNCIIAEFSTLKVVSASNSKVFRNNFLANLEKLFLVPANTFDNVNGDFPIGFFIWDTKIKNVFSTFEADVYNNDGNWIKSKNIYSYDNQKGRVNDWLRNYKTKESIFKGVLMADAPDFQNNNYIALIDNIGKRHGIYFLINETNLIPAIIYYSVRHCFESTWLNDRDQFLFPSNEWISDQEFQNDCLAFTLFHSQNKITSSEGTNHWIPFTEYEVNAQAKFESHFMTDFIKGKIGPEASGDTLFEQGKTQERKPLDFSEEATAVFDAGRELWKYYHAQPSSNSGFGRESKPYNVNASLYDIRAYFQGRNAQGRMNSKSDDPTYTALISELRNKLSILAEKIQPKVYEYGFLKM